MLLLSLFYIQINVLYGVVSLKLSTPLSFQQLSPSIRIFCSNSSDFLVPAIWRGGSPLRLHSSAVFVHLPSVLLATYPAHCYFRIFIFFYYVCHFCLPLYFSCYGSFLSFLVNSALTFPSFFVRVEVFLQQVNLGSKSHSRR